MVSTLVGVVAESDLQALQIRCQQLHSALGAVELRLDYLPRLDIPAVASLLNSLSVPAILTLRSKTEGGFFAGNGAELADMVTKLAALQPTYLDIDASLPDCVLTEIHRAYPQVKLIRSYHNFERTPDNLGAIFKALQHPAVSLYKLATMANSATDNLRLHVWQQGHRDSALQVHCMGELGLPSRLMGVVLGNAFIYTSPELDWTADAVPAPGCPALRTLLDDYRLPRLTQHSQFCALLGCPVEHSIGHQFHNALYQQHNIDALYLKFCLIAAEIPQFLELAKSLPFIGFSVTTPLKEDIVPALSVLDETTKEVQAVNTILRDKDCWSGSNTDGRGAMVAMEACLQEIHWQERRVLVLGAGGVAKPIAFELAKQKVKKLLIANRNEARAQSLAASIQAQACRLSFLLQVQQENKFDVLINCLPSNEETEDLVLSLAERHCKSHALVFNVDYANRQSELETALTALGLTVLSPLQLFYQQARLQVSTWFGV